MAANIAIIEKTQGKRADVTAEAGLTGEEARHRLEKFGSNAIPDTSVHPLRTAIESAVFWTLDLRRSAVTVTSLS